MIEYIKGTLDRKGRDHIIVDHGGIGWLIYVPACVLDRLPGIGSAVCIYTHMHVREDLMCLYGFLSREDMEIFKLLITVNGIGPKGALAVLSALTPDQLRFAVLAGDAKTIAKAPGIGAKTAQRLIIELKDKLDLAMPEEEGLTHPSMSIGPQAGLAKNDALQALIELGYSQTEAALAISRCSITEDMTADGILKLALHQLI